MTTTKQPTAEYIVKAYWDATAVYLIVPAKDEIGAWDKAWKRVSRMEGGDMCKSVKVIRRLT